MYLPLKALHILAVVLFLGNIITGVFWKAHADRSRDPALIAHALAGIIRSDRWFTLPGVAIILLTGVWLALEAGYPLLHTGWIFWSLLLFSVSGLAFMFWIAPQQRRMLALAEAGRAGGGMDWLDYRRVSRHWTISGAIGTLTPLLALLLMVLKPALPGVGG